MRNRQSDSKSTKQIRIDSGLHKLLKIKATMAGTSIKELLEGYLAELLAVDNQVHDHKSNSIENL